MAFDFTRLAGMLEIDCARHLGAGLIGKNCERILGAKHIKEMQKKYLQA